MFGRLRLIVNLFCQQRQKYCPKLAEQSYLHYENLNYKASLNRLCHSSQTSLLLIINFNQKLFLFPFNISAFRKSILKL